MARRDDTDNDGRPPSQQQGHRNPTLFVDPLMGAPLVFFLDQSIDNHDTLIHLIQLHGGLIVNNYANDSLILVDPLKESGADLVRQFAGDKGRVILDAKWVRKCVERASLQTHLSNWAECRVMHLPSRQSLEPPDMEDKLPADELEVSAGESVQPHTLLHGPTLFSHDARRILPSTSTQSWIPSHDIESGTSNARHSVFAPGPPWIDHEFDGLAQHSSQTYDYHFRSDDHWTPQNDFYSQFSAPVADYDSNFAGQLATTSEGPRESPRGRKRTRTRLSDPSNRPRIALTARRAERSPTPPTVVQKSTHGGNNFTEEDVKYLEKYIRYCQNQGLALSLREICERVALKAPHHTFYSWRRYCNKHQIRLGGYEMEPPSKLAEERGGLYVGPEGFSPSITHHEASESLHLQDIHEQLEPSTSSRAGPSRGRSPSPPRILFRSTTGKGIAFTEDDVNFLIQYMSYWRDKGETDMVQFWRRVAEKAPHHSRASWMKYWRRHKHELEGHSSVPPRPEKKRKYDLDDDLLLAKFFAKKHEGTSDEVFQAFAYQHPHHPWKGWQEHHRLHKTKIDQIIEQINSNEVVTQETEL